MTPDITQFSWENIATSDRFRTASQQDKSQLRSLWMRDVAPQFYGENLQNPDFYSAVSRYVYTHELPQKLENEDEIIGSALSHRNFNYIEENPLYAQKSYNEQQLLKQVWFAKMQQNDPEFSQLSFEDKTEFYNRLISRAPTMSSLLVPLFDEEDEKTIHERWTNAQKGAVRFSSNIVHSFVDGFGSLVLGPMRLLSPDGSAMEQFFLDVEKQRQWVNTVTEEQRNFLTNALPNFVGYGAGLVLGPFHGLEKLFAGTAKLTGAAGSKMIQVVPGMLSKAGAKLGAKLPEVAYQTAGGAIAGMVQGVSEALAKGEKWDTYLARDATIGLGVEFLTRYAGMARMLRTIAREANIPTNQLHKYVSSIGSKDVFSKELETLIQADPSSAHLLKYMHLVDENGLLLQAKRTPSGLSMQAKLLDNIETTFDDKMIQFTKKNGETAIFNDAIPEVRLDKAQRWLDIQPEARASWENSLVGKSIQEAVNSADNLEVRLGVRVPQSARNRIAKSYEAGYRALTGGASPPKGRDMATVYDEIYTHAMQSSGTVGSNKKAAKSLWNMGYTFGGSEDEHLAEFHQLVKDLRELRSESSYIIMEGGGKRIASADDIPIVGLTHPDVKNPFKVNQTFVGSPRDIRQLFRTIRKQTSTTKRAFTTTAKGHNMSIKRFLDTQMVEIDIKAPMTDSAGNRVLRDVTINFKSVKEAQKFFTGTVDKKLQTVNKSIFKGNEDKEVFEKYFSKTKYAGKEMVESEYMPFKYTQAEAAQKGYYLGLKNGKYVLQHFDEDSLNFEAFDSIADTLDFLKKVDPLPTLPDFAHGLSQSAIESMYPEGFADPLQDLPYEQIKAKHKLGLSRLLSYNMTPPQHMLRQFENLESVVKLKAKYGFSPVNFHNRIRQMTMTENAFLNNMRLQLQNIQGGRVSKKESEMVMRWMEAVTDKSEVPHNLRSATKEVGDSMFKLKADIESEMTQAFGGQRAQELIKKGTELSQYYESLFSLSGMNWAKYIKYYHPHMADSLERMHLNLSTRIDVKRFTEIPVEDKEFFFELLREVDPRDVLWEKDAFKVAEIYTHLMARKLYVRPMMKDMGSMLRQMTKEMGQKGMTENDYMAVVHYFSKMFETIEGIKSPFDELMRYATDNTFQTVCDAVNKKFGTALKMTKKHNLMSEFITVSTGAHLAARPWPVFRNLTQSLLTGGSTIGTRWWMEGLDEVLNNPGQLARLRNLGMITDSQVPVGAGWEIAENGLGSLVHKGMIPYKWADHVNRAIVFTGMEKRFDSAFKKYMTGGKKNIHKFVRESGMNLFGKAEYNEMINIINSNSGNTARAYKAVKTRLARLASDYTQYLYNSFDQPYALRNGVGKIFGQYTSWPLNFYNLVKSRLLSDSLTVQQKIGFFARLGTITGAIATGLHSAGINPQGFAPWNMVMISGGPYYQLLHDALASANGDQQAYAKVVRGLSSLVPFVYEGEGVLKAIQAFQEGEFYEAFLYLASAPVRMDVYPKRRVVTDRVEQSLIDAGTRYFSATKDLDLIQSAKSAMGVDFGL